MQDTPAPQRRHLGQLLQSVVKVLTVSDAPDYDQPWQTRGASSSSGSGVIVITNSGRRILTNAHCVENHAFVEVRRNGDARNYVARVVALGYECDLALLDVADEKFFDGIQPISLGELPELSDSVSVCGYPVGGERLSITNGVVSRVEVVRYAHRQRRLLAVQIDAAINSGNSGGPVLMDGKIVGIAFQSLDEADQIGYMIATPVIRHFLEDAENGTYQGFPSLGTATQALKSRAHRRFLQLPDDIEGGVFISRIIYNGSAYGTLKRGDVLLEVDGIPIAADRTVRFRDNEVLTFDHIIHRHQVGDTLEAKVWRDGASLSCVIRLKGPRYLVAENNFDAPPKYYVLGGMLLVPLTRDYLRTWDDWWATAPNKLMDLYGRGIATEDMVEPVVLQKVLADEVNQGYHHLESVVIAKAQGQTVKSLRHLIEIVESSNAEFLQLESDVGYCIVLEREHAMDATRGILERYRVPFDRSVDLRD